MTSARASRARRSTETSDEAWFYGRVSLDRDGNMFAVSRQDEEVEPFAGRLSLRITRRYADNSISATDPSKVRPEFERLLTDLEAAPYPKPAVIVWHLDRLIRVTRDLERVIETDANVHALHAGHVDLSTPAGRAVARTIVAWSTYEGEIRTERQLAKFAQMARQGTPHWSARPFGFEMDGEHRQDEAGALRKAYQDFVDGKSMAEIARKLNAAGFTGSKGGAWSSETVSFVLASPRNAGLREHHGEIVGAGTWKPIVTKELWDAARQILADPERQRYSSVGSVQTLLSGVAICAPCTAVVKASKRYNMLPGGRRGANPERQAYPTYKCSVAGHVTHQMEFVDRYVLKAAELLLRDPVYRARWLGGGSAEAERAVALHEERDTLTTRLEELAEDRALPVGAMTRQQFIVANARVLTRLDAIEVELETLGTEQARSELADLLTLHGAVSEMPTDKARAMIRSLFPKLELHRQHAGQRYPSGDDIRLYVNGDDGSLVALPTLSTAALDAPIPEGVDPDEYWLEGVFGLVRGVDYE